MWITRSGTVKSKSLQSIWIHAAEQHGFSCKELELFRHCRVGYLVLLVTGFRFLLALFKVSAPKKLQSPIVLNLNSARSIVSQRNAKQKCQSPDRQNRLEIWSACEFTEPPGGQEPLEEPGCFGDLRVVWRSL